MKLIHCIILFFLFQFGPLYASAQTFVNPKDYGIMEASNGTQRYMCLLACHKEAIKKNAMISYRGVKSLDLEIPVNAESIPLPEIVDFAGVQINVLNTQRNIVLFTRTANTNPIMVSSEAIDQGRFHNENFIQNGPLLLIINDASPWVDNRNGYGYGVTRKDLIVVNNSISVNLPIYPYANAQSIAKTTAVQIDSQISYSNIKFYRDAKSTKITYLFNLSNAYDIKISNVSITTPQDNNLYGDAAIQVNNCAKVIMNGIEINGTYSLSNKYGYGINLDNVAMFYGERIYARARWGVFGNNNVNGAILRDCDINRFDIHCYGRDVKFYNCKFTDLYNQFSSFFGVLHFEKCTFSNFIPVLMDPSYNAYTPFDLTFKSCTFNLTGKKNYLMTLYGLEESHNSRPELSRKALPNITIKNCTVNLADDVKEWYIVNTGKVDYQDPLDYINKVEVNRLKINGNVDYKVFSTDIKTTNTLKVVRKRVKMNRK